MEHTQLILALDTASDAIALAVGSLSCTDNATKAAHITPLASGDLLARREANVQLVPAIERLFKEHALKKEQLKGIVCGRGPGSFTGVRIAVATAKGLAAGLEVPLFGIATPDAQAWQAWQGGFRGTLAVLSDAMRGEVYPARYILDQEGAKREDSLSVVKADELVERWQVYEGILTLTGDALYKYGELFRGFAWLDESYWRPKGEGLLSAFEANLRVVASLQDAASLQAGQTTQLASGMQAILTPSTAFAQQASPTYRALLSNQAPSQQEVRQSIAALLPVYTRLSDAEENERKRLISGGAIAQGALIEVPASGVASPEDRGQLSYRPAAKSDSSALAELEQSAYALTESAVSGECWTEEMYLDDMTQPQRSWWVCYQHDELVGFGGGQMIEGQMHILDVVVRESYRRQGIARQLLARLAQDAKDLGATELTLEVRESNAAAQALYQQLGFQVVGRRKNYYSPRVKEGSREDALIMTGAVDAALLREAIRIKSNTVQETARDQAAPLALQAQQAHSAQQTLLTQKTQGAEQPLQTQQAQGAEQPLQIQQAQGALQAQYAPHPPQAHQASHAEGSLAYPHPRILAIESSCDETAAAVIDGEGVLLSNVVASQTDFHARFGGVVPEIASRKHTEAIYPTVLEALGGMQWRDLDAVAVTYAPGLIGALVVGLAFAKGLCWASDLPLIVVDHLEGHIYANRFVGSADAPSAYRLSKAILQPPFIVALLSGGNTLLVQVNEWGSYEVLGGTLDDAIGEAYDKVAKALGLGYPGGPVIARLAKEGNPQAFDFPRALLHSHDYQFSFSGLKTAVLTVIREQVKAGTLNSADIAASFEQAVIEVQVAKALDACERLGVTSFCIGGGVASNTALREAYQRAMEPRGIKVLFPPPIACTDNAAMIAAVALDRFKQERFSALDQDAAAQSDLSEAY